MSKRMLMAVVIAMLAMVLGAGSAQAALDPDSDSMGVYFDVAGNTDYRTLSLFTPTPVYLILVNPTAGIDGFAVAMDRVGAPHVILSQDFGSGRIDEDSTQSGVRVIASYPVLAGSPLVLGTWSLMLQEGRPLNFYLGPHPDPSLPRGLPVIRRGGQWIRCGTSSGDVTLPVAGLNSSFVPVPVELESFGSIKSLFR